MDNINQGLETVEGIPPNLKSGSKYDWPLLLNGAVWKVSPNYYGTNSPKQFSSTARNAATRYGYTKEDCTIAVRDQFVYIHAHQGVREKLGLS